MKTLIAAIAGLLLLLGGCACDTGTPSESAATPTPAVPPSNSQLQLEDPLSRLSGAYMLSGASDTLSGGSYDSFFEDEVALLISSGTLESTDLHINKTGNTQNEADAVAYGLNAAVTVRDAGSAALADALISTNGLGAAAVFCSGADSTVSLSGGLISTASGASPAIAALDSATVTLEDTELLTDSIKSPCLLARVDGSIEAHGVRGNATESPFSMLDSASVSLVNCTLSGSGARLSGTAALAAEGGTLTGRAGEALFTSVSGDTSLSLTGVALNRPEGGALLSVLSGRLSLLGDYQALEGELAVADSAELALILQNNSTYTGSLSADSRMYLSLTLDASSRWFVTGDSYVEALTNADATLQNIESNGFTVYYNSENEANAWLDSKPYALPGGGYLSPII